MQNRTAILVFTVLLSLVCLYQISFSFVTSGVEGEAEDYANHKIDSLKQASAANGLDYVVVGSDTLPFKSDRDFESIRNTFEQRYLERKNNETVYPLLGYTYGFCKQNELNLGLDLQGGMAVTLELSVPDLTMNLADYSTNSRFVKAYNEALKNAVGNEDFLDEFLSAANDQDVNLALEFSYGAAKDDIDRKMSNEEVVEVLKVKAEKAVENTESILLTRIDKFGVSQPQLSRQAATGRIMIELPGVKDKNRVRNQLQATANLEFWETYPLSKIELNIEELDYQLSEMMYPNFRDSVERAQRKLQEEKANEQEEEKEEEVAVEPIDTTDLLAAIDTNQVDDTLNTVDSDSFSLDDENDDDLFAEDNDSEFEFDEVVDSSGAKYNKEDDGQLSKEDFTKIRPLFSKLQLNVVNNEQTGKSYWRREGELGIAQISDTSAINSMLKNPVVESTLPSDLVLMWGAKPITNSETGEPTENLVLYALKASADFNGPVMTGDAVDNAYQEFDQNTSQVEVQMTMTDAGQSKWAEITQRAAADNNRPVAITLDNLVYSAPSVENAITSGITSISGSFTQDEAKDLATLLNAGSLPAKLKIVEESIVGPSLGKENVESGLTSFVIALLVVLAYMVFYYGKSGLVADVALFANIFFLVGTLASLQAALTLPGIAGIVLTIGMSVDANVLIFERIREEIRAGKGMKLAISDGYKRAYAAIVDANITTLLTAIVLSVFGSGPIQGFATTLIIGIFTSLFSAIFITRLIFTKMLDKKRSISFATAVTKNAFTKINVKWLKRRKVYYVVSGLIIAAGIFSLTSNSLDYGVEFSGGRMFKIVYTEQADADAARTALAKHFVSDAGVEMKPEIKTIDDNYTLKVTTKFHAKDHSEKASEIVDAAVREAHLNEMGLTEGAQEKGYEVIETRQVDAQISDELIYESFFAIVFSLIVIFLYILLRFRKWQFGLGALLAMAHDVLLVLGVFSLLYKVMPFSMEVDQAFIAAILTVVGYSINDTVVVFDRIREFLGLHKRRSSDEVVNEALNSTLSRTINTSMSTFIVLLIIFLFGGEAIKGFTFALMIGVIVGTYSSLCIATPAAFDLSKRKLTLGDQNESLDK